MHRIWRITEIVDMIMSDLSRDTLAKLARTHSCFFELAASRLWKDLNARYLLKLFDIIEEDPAESKPTDYLHRYAAYMRSIRSLALNAIHYDIDVGPRPDPTSYETVIGIAKAMSLSEHQFLPSLCVLEVDMARTGDLDLQETTSFLLAARLFLTNTILELRFLLDPLRNFDGTDEDVEEDQIVEFLQMAKRNCPILQDFTLSGLWADRTTPRFLEQVGETVSGFKSLRRFQGELWAWKDPVLSSLRTHPTLQTLVTLTADQEVSDDVDMDLMGTGKSVGTEIFPSLRYLNLEGSPEIVEACLRACSGARELKSLIMKTDTDPLSAVSVAETIGIFFTLLQSLTWTDASYPAPPPGACRCGDILTALEPCRSLVELTLHMCDQDGHEKSEPFSLLPILSARPYLRKLHLCARHHFTFDELAHLAGHCCSIQSIALGVDKEAEVYGPRNVKPSDQTVLFWISAPLQHPAPEVASFLYSLWPNIVFPPAAYGANHSRNLRARKTWEPVISIVKALRTDAVLQKEMAKIRT